MRVITSGSRLATLDPGIIWGVLDSSPLMAGAEVVLNGRCPTGVDAAAWRWALARGFVPGRSLLAFPADWRCWGAAAGPLRNGQMAHAAQGCVALLDGVTPNRGTRDMIQKARLHRLELEVYTLRLNGRYA